MSAPATIVDGHARAASARRAGATPRPFALLACVLALALSGCSIWPWRDRGDEGAAGEPEPPKVQATIEGLDADLEVNVRAHLGILSEACDAPEWRARRVFGRSNDEIRKALRALGHYRPTIERDFQSAGDCWQATFTIDPGPVVEVARVELNITGEASEDPKFAALEQALPLEVGEPLNHAHYAASKQRIESLAASRGYLDARFTRSELRVDPDAGTAEALLEFDSGRRYLLGPLTIEQDTVRDELARRLVTYTEGAPYSSETIQGIDRALSDSGYFANVEVRPDLRQPVDGQVPVHVTAESRNRHSYSAGIGFATDVGPRLRLGYENRRINKRGHRFYARSLLSLVKQDAVAEYRIPLDDPRSEWLSFTAGALREDNDTFETQALKLGVRRTRVLFTHWLQASFLEFIREDFQIGQQDGQATLLVPGLSIARTVSDDKLRPSRGWRLFAEVRGAAEALLSETSFVALRLDGGWLRTLPWGGRVIARSQLGAMAVSDFDALPPSQRFFTGGDTSVRGYDFESLGPKDSGGEVIGGRYLAVASLEYEHPVLEKWSVAAFVDTGNAFSSRFDEGLRTGVGVGLRWQSPIGPVRVDVAHPLDDEEDNLFRLHLRLGPDL